MRYAMAIDTRKCVGCSDCVVACQTENNVPIGYCRDWVVEVTDGTYPQLEIEIRSERCNQCDNSPLSFIWSAIHIREIFPRWNWKFKILIILNEFFTKYKLPIAWVMTVSSVILGVYTGILFSAFNARPLWNTSILGLLFLASGLSAGAAVTMLFSKNHLERTIFSKIDITIIVIELFLIVHMFMGFLASTQVQIKAAKLFLGGPYTASFWIFVVILGMIIPVILEILELKKYKIPVLIPATLVLFGSLMLRFLISYAGQESRWLY